MRLAVLFGLTTFVLVSLTPPAVQAEQLPMRYRKAIDNGLKWVAENQKRDGSWSATNGQYPIAMTAAGRNVPSHGGKHRSAGQVCKEHSPGRRLVDGSGPTEWHDW